MRDQFHMILPSNSSMDIYPENTTACYVTKLPRELNLRGDWEVGMSEIHFSRSFFHLSGENRKFTVIWNTKKGWVKKEFQLYRDFYINLKDFVDTLNSTLSFDHVPVALKIFPSGGKEYVHIFVACDEEKCPVGTKLIFNRAILRILGYEIEGDTITVWRESQQGSKPANLQGAFPKQLFVYTDICEPYVVGDVQAQLLRIVPISYKDYEFGSTQHHSFSAVNYIPLITNSLRTITIDIRSDTGERIPFETGTSIVTLQFRQRQ